MNMTQVNKLAVYLSICVAVSMISGAAWAERILVTNDDTVVTTDDVLVCSKTIDVRVESSSPEVFENESIRMQVLVDSVQAILHYECPKLRRLQISGILRGLDNPVYAGNAKSEDRWLVTTRQSITAQDLEAMGQSGGYSPHGYVGETAANRQLELTSIKLDMTVNQVKQRIWNVFGSEPSYDPVPGIMNLELGGCPPGRIEGDTTGHPKLDWVCLKASFTDRRIAKLYRLGYTQVVQGSMREVRNALIDKYGPPNTNERRQKNEREMVWHIETAGAGNQVFAERLEAKFSRVGRNIVIDIYLQDPDLSERYGGPTKNRPERGQSSETVELNL